MEPQPSFTSQLFFISPWTFIPVKMKLFSASVSSLNCLFSNSHFT